MSLDLDGDLRRELLELGTATLYEASGLDCDLPSELRAAWRAAKICGPAFPLTPAPSTTSPSISR